MPYNLDIPGQVSGKELAFIERLARRVATGGRVVELGSLFGRSAWAWAKSVDPTVTVYCIDPWQREPWIEELEERFGVPFTLDTFHRHTADCSNIVALPGYSPTDVGDWNLPIDLYFDDSVHDNPVLRQNLDFWLDHMKPGGIMCGTAYLPEFADVVQEIDGIAERLSTTVEVVGMMWMLEIPTSFRPSGEWAGEPPLPPLAKEPPKIDSDIPALPRTVGTMIKPEELELLYSIARHHCRGDGAIIDLGPFLGSSTIMLVEGLRRNPAFAERSPRVYSFDRFIYEPYKGFDDFLSRDDLPTLSFFPHFLANLGQQRLRYVYCSPGDFLQFSWSRDPVEILFVDLAKTPQLHDHLVRQFFGTLIAEHSVVVQQDYFYYGCPWIIVAMEHFADWLCYVGSAVGGTALFQSRAKIPDILVRTPVDVAINLQRQIRLLELAAERQRGTNRESLVEIARAYLLWCSGERDAAQGLLDSINPSRMTDAWSHDLEWNLAAARQELGA